MIQLSCPYFCVNISMTACSRSFPIRHAHFISFLFLWRSGEVSEVSSDTASSSMHRWIVHEYFTASVRFTGLNSHWLHCHEKLNRSFKHWPAFLMNEAVVSAHLNPNENEYWADFIPRPLKNPRGASITWDSPAETIMTPAGY